MPAVCRRRSLLHLVFAVSLNRSVVSGAGFALVLQCSGLLGRRVALAPRAARVAPVWGRLAPGLVYLCLVVFAQR